MKTAYVDAMGRSADSLNLGGGTIAGLSFAPGVYKWGTSLDITGKIYCNGTAVDSERLSLFRCGHLVRPV